MNEKSLRVLEFNAIKEEVKKFTSTNAGKDLIDELRPFDNIYEVREHLEETKEALSLLNTKGSPPFEGVYDVREGIKKAEKASMLLPFQLLQIAAVLRSARKFKEYITVNDNNQSYRVLGDISQGLIPLKGIEDHIFNAIASEEVISDKASITLFNIRRAQKDKNANIREKVNSLIRTYSQYLQDSLYTVRGDRYVIPVKTENKNMVAGLVHDQSSSGATLYIEPMSLVNLNNEIKELMLKEKAEIEKILTELSAEIYVNITAVKSDANIIWELDMIFAKAKYASEHNCICPEVNEKGIMDIIEARHPLIDPKHVVPGSIYLGKEFTSLVITGPNTGGKTVTLKTVGLLHIMALSGMMIPARENSTIGFFKEIFADIGDEQSIAQNLSTFSSHMTNIVKIIENADESSLVLFDELGAGTDPTEGAALAVSILENLRKRNVRLIGTTHYSELKAYALKTPCVENASVEFDVETLRPTYRLLIGIPGKSNAFEISKRLGLPDYIIDDARLNISGESLKFEDLIQSLQEKSIKAENDAMEASSLKLEAQKLRDKQQEKLLTVQNTREKAMIEAKREAKRFVRDAKDEADRVLKNIRDLEKMGYSSDARQKLEDERKKLKDKMDDLDTVAISSEEKNATGLTKVTVGEEVFIPTLNQKVIVLSKPDSKGEVQVQAGIMKVNIKLSKLTSMKGNSKVVKTLRRREAKLNLSTVATSVDLRGMDSEEAVYTVDKYLDDASLSGLTDVTIIHGKGTGVLRTAINDMLKRHYHVKSHRLGAYGEGGSGVTMVELKQ